MASEPQRLMGQIGRSGLVQYGGQVFAEFDPDLRMPHAARVYDEMRRADPTIAMGLRVIKWFLGRIAWSVEPAGATPADEEAAAFLDSCMQDMEQPWSKFLRDALTCLEFGFAYMEMVLKLRDSADGQASRYDDGRIGWRKFTLIGQQSLARWDFDEWGAPQAFIQQGDLIGGKYWQERAIPITKALLFRIDDEQDNPEGISLLRPIYLAWYAKKQIEEIEAIGIERDLTGVLIIHLPESATSADQTKAQQLLEQFKADDMAGFTAPQFGPGEHQRWRFEIINSPGQKSIDADKAIRRRQLEIARSFLAQFLMLGQDPVGGSRALSQDQSDVFSVALGAILVNVEDTINRYAVPPLFRFNDFGKLTALPKIKAGRVSKADALKFAQALQALAAAGMLTPDADLERFLREELELPAQVESDEEAPASDQEDTGQQTTAKDKKQASEAEPDELDNADPYGDDDEDRIDEILKELERSAKQGRGLAERLSFVGPKFTLQPLIDGNASRMERQMGSLSEQFREGKISYDQWAASGKAAIQDGVRTAQKLGIAEARGVYPPSKIKLTEDERVAANKMVDEQLRYFSEFRRQVRQQMTEGKPLTTAIDARAKLYQGANKSSVQQAKIAASPKDQILKWVRHKSDSCETCIKMEGKTKTAAEWAKSPILPARGTKCHGNCGCSLNPA